MGKSLELITSGGDLCVSGPILFSIFVSIVSSSTSMGLLKLWNWNICLAELCFMLLTRNALSPYHLGEPQQTLHWLEPVLWWCGWPNACGSWYDCKTHLSNNHQGTLKRQGLWLTSLCGLHRHITGPHSKIVGREGELTWVLPLLGSRMRYLGFLGFTLYRWI